MWARYKYQKKFSFSVNQLNFPTSSFISYSFLLSYLNTYNKIFIFCNNFLLFYIFLETIFIIREHYFWHDKLMSSLKKKPYRNFG